MKLSKRLETVASFVPEQARVADIGSDHAYLPCYLVEQKNISFAVAGEVVKGPFESAKKTVSEQDLSHCIDVRLGDGLEVIQPSDNIDTVTICGMGGDLISHILERGKQQNKLNGVTKLILQPNVDEEHVRQWLMANQYQIIHECILKENKKIYEVIVAQPSPTAVHYSKEQLQFGVYLSLNKEAVFIEKWQSEIEKYDKVIASLKKSTKDETQKIQHFKEKQALINEVIK